MEFPATPFRRFHPKPPKFARQLPVYPLVSPQMNASRILSVLLGARRPVFIPHRHPDGDALGSALALYHTVRLRAERPHLVVPTPAPRTLEWLPGIAEAIVHTAAPEAAETAVAEADLLVFVDFGDIRRLDRLAEAIERSAAPTLLIDHHPDPQVATSWQWWDPQAPATALLVHRLLRHAGHPIRPEVAQCLLTGIVTDTGRFNHSATAEVFAATADLLAAGADLEAIIQNVFYRFSEPQLRFWGHVLAQKMEIFTEYHTALITISRGELQQRGLSDDDLEGLANFPLQIEDVFISVLIRETPEEVKLSFRSRGPYPVNRFAAEYFKGGGHFHAAGARSFRPLDEVIAQFKASLPRFWAALASPESNHTR